MRTKTNSFYLALASCDYDVIVLTESWLHSNISNAELTSNYTIFRCDRSLSTSVFERGGGVLIAVKVSLRCKSVTIENCERLEQVIVCITLPRQSIFISSIYLPPNSDPELYSIHSTAMQELSDRVSISDIVVAFGDYNLPDLTWLYDEDVNGLLPSNASSEQEVALTESMMAIGFHQVNSVVNANGRILDLAFVNDTDNLELIEPPSSILKIDPHHKPFVLKLDVRCSVKQPSNVRNNEADFDFNRCDFHTLNNIISRTDWNELLQNVPIDNAVTNFYKKIYFFLQENVPRKRRSDKETTNNQPWWTPELRNLRNRVRKARKRFFRLKSDENKNSLQAIEEQYNIRQTAIYRDYISHIQVNLKHNPSAFWSFIKSRKKGPVVPDDVQYGGITARSAEESADLFADFFQSVYSTSPPQNRNRNTRYEAALEINLPPLTVTVTEVRDALEDLDPTKGAGTDRLPPLFLRNCANSLAIPVAQIFNQSLHDKRFPEQWKTASIVPIHKAGNTHRVENYRGISILNCLGKVLESIVHKVLYRAAQPVISEFQHGFVKKRSTTTNLMCFTNMLFYEVERRRQVDTLYVDFSKAFDKVPHALAIEKLQGLGFPNWITDWLRSYLAGRTAFVKLNGCHSKVFHIASGVPQGSILGPLIFVLFMNDLCSRLKSGKLLYADDLKIFRVVTSLVDCCALQEDIDEIQRWCIENGMELNIGKTKVVSFTRRRSLINFDYSINSNRLERVESIRDLGVIIDSKLRFNDHIAATTAKAFAVLGFIRRNTTSFDDIYALKSLYCSLVRSIVEYAVVIWAPYHLTQIVRIERVQRAFVRYALRQLPWRNPQHFVDYEERCRLINLQTLSSRRTQIQRLLTFDLLRNNIDCPYLLQNLNMNVPRYQLRDQPLLVPPFHRTTYGYNNPLSACIRAFNTVDSSFDFDMSKNSFKHRIKNLD